MSDHQTPERPKAEPEIIPPDRPDPWRRDTRRIWPSGHDSHVRFVQFRTGGPLAFLIALLLLGLGAAVVLALLVGVVLLWIPLTVAIALAIIWSFLFKRR
jgi:hypothetical protein